MKRLVVIAALGWARRPSMGARPEPGVRAHDQAIVFPDECRYERTAPKTGAKPYRKVVIELR